MIFNFYSGKFYKIRTINKQNVKFMRKLKFFLTCLLMASISLVSAQTKTASGTVVSAEDGQPVIGASVMIKGTSQGTTTNVNGRYSFSVPATARTLVISLVGMKSVEVDAEPNVNVRMETEISELEEVMVVAYGTAKKSSFTGSASTVNTEKLALRSVASITKALDGTVAGVQSTLGSGQPGSGASIIIRGFGSINASSSPLYVVDGIPYDGNINSINPADIENITILKDASAGSLYGSRGANGVVMITTKSGKDTNGKIGVNFKASLGVSSRAIPRYNTLNQSEFLEATFQAYKNDEFFAKGVPAAQAATNAINRMKGTVDGILGVGEQYNPFNMPLAELIDPLTGKVNPSATLKWTDNWLDEVTAVNPIRKEYQIDITGGTRKSKALVSLGYLDEDGLLKTTNFKRISARVSAEHEATDWFTMGMSANLSNNKTNFLGSTGSSTSNIWYSAEQMAPIYPIWERDATGAIKNDAQGKPLFDYGASRAPGAQQNFNSIATLYDDKYYSSSDNVSGRTFVKFDTDHEKYGLFKGFGFAMNLGFDLVNGNSTTYYNPYFGNAGGTVKGRLTKENGRTFSYTFNQLLTWNRKFDMHSVDVLLGHEYYDYTYNYLTAQKTGFPFGGLFELASGSTIADADSYENNESLESYFSRLNYNFADKYYFSASFRTDGSSRFQKDNRWGNFWSVGASWRVSEESFMQGLTWLDNLTYKISYGTQGNNTIGLYPWQSFYDLTYNNAGLNGALVTSLENKLVSWEKNANFNTGIEARLFNRLSLSVEYYNKLTTDLLLFRPMATSLGFNGFYDNVGSMRNQGFDASIGYDLIKTQDLVWNINAMASTVKNKVLKLTDEAKEIIAGSTIIREGEELNSFYMARSAGVDPATGAQLYWVYDKKDDEKNLDKHYISSDKTKAAASRVILGSRIPDVYGSVSTSVTYKGFDFSLMTTYSIGGKIYDYVGYNYTNPLYSGNNFSKDVLRAWKQPGDITDIPRIQKDQTLTLNDRALIDASYFSIKNIGIGYTFTNLGKLGLDAVRVFAQGDNLHIFTHRQGINPQYNFSGSTDFVYAPNRVIAAGINVKF